MCRKPATNTTRSAVVALGADVRAAADRLADALKPLPEPAPAPAPARAPWRVQVLELLLAEKEPKKKAALRFIAYNLPSDLTEVIEVYLENYKARDIDYDELLEEFSAIKDIRV